MATSRTTIFPNVNTLKELRKNFKIHLGLTAGSLVIESELVGGLNILGQVVDEALAGLW